MAQLMQDPAVLRGLSLLALTPQRLKLLAEGSKHGDPLSDVTDVLVNQSIHSTTILLRGITHIQQSPNLVQRHVQRTGVPDEDEPLDIVDGVLTIIPERSRGFREQAGTFVIANSFRLATRRQRRFTDSHRRSSGVLTLKLP
jgi:hypothetical protein